MQIEHCSLDFTVDRSLLALISFSAIVGEKPYWLVSTLLRSFAAIRSKDMGSNSKKRWDQERMFLRSKKRMLCADGNGPV